MATNIQLLSTQTPATQEKVVLPLKHRTWITNNHSISFTSFVKHFEYYDQATANSDYKNILDGAKFTNSVRQKLRSDFKFFQENMAKDFWVRRLQARNTRIAVTRTSIALQDAGAKEAQRNLENYSAACAQRQTFSEDLEDHGYDNDGHDNTHTDEMVISGGPNHESADDQAEDLKSIKEVARMSASPFLPLIEYIYAKIQGGSPMMPSIPLHFPGSNIQELYIFAHNNLQTQAGSKKFDIDKNVL
ncbi:hypothetical protein EC957_010609, partial [Mortierella hygrophila]